MEEWKSSFPEQREEDERYIEIYNIHYNSNNGIRPMFQLPSKYFFNRFCFSISKLLELGGMVGIIYGAIENPNYLFAGVLSFACGILFDMGTLPMGRIYRGKEIAYKRGLD